MTFVTSVRPEGSGRVWSRALQLVQADPELRLAHMDTGLFPHRALGFRDGAVPANVRIADGLNLLDPSRTRLPLTDLTRAPALGAGLIEFPDHGVKTLSVILADDHRFKGLAPGATVVPYRVSNGPLFWRGTVFDGGPLYGHATPTKLLGEAIDHALAAPVPPRVISISMGNPGALGPVFGPILAVAGGEVGMDEAVRRAVKRAWRAGVIVVCAAGQVIDRMIYPARWRETIAVAGFAKTGSRVTRYPLLGYDLDGWVDVSARAVGLNRASGHLDVGRIVETWADDDPFAGEPSGTSYACPQVAATALLWTARWRRTLDGAAFSGASAWRRVEAFRGALRALPTATAHAVEDGRREVVRLRLLDVERVIETEPDPSLERPWP